MSILQSINIFILSADVGKCYYLHLKDGKLKLRETNNLPKIIDKACGAVEIFQVLGLKPTSSKA